MLDRQVYHLLADWPHTILLVHFSVLIKNTSHVMIAKFLSVTVLHRSKSREAASYFLNPLCLYLTNDMLPFFAFPSFEICIICIFHSSFFIFVSWLQPLPQSLILRLSTMIFPFSAKNFIFYYLLLCSLITVCVAGVSLPELSSFPTSPHSHSSFNNKKFPVPPKGHTLRAPGAAGEVISGKN